MLLRSVAGPLLGLVLLGTPSAAQARVDYAGDVTFLLDEMEDRARDLLRQKDVDWKKVRAEFSKRAKTVRDDDAHVALCGELLARLRDGHASFTEMRAQLPEGPRRYGAGVSLCEQGKRVFVKNAFGPALAAGVTVGCEVLSIDGQKPLDWIATKTGELRRDTGFSTEHAARYGACHWGVSGEAGRTLRLELDRGKAGKKKCTLSFDMSAGAAQFIGPVFPVEGLTELGHRDAYGTLPSGYGYVYLRECAANLAEELDTALTALRDVPGLILDMRANGGGGTDHDEVFGRFLAPGTQWKGYESSGASPYAGPMVVIVDAGTRSTGETVSGQFKEDGRAYMIGPQPTAGMSAQKVELEVPSKLFKVRFAVHSNKQRFNGGKGIEGIGVPPHEIVPWDVEALRAGVDPMLARAEALLTEGFPKGSVPYQPPQAKK